MAQIASWVRQWLAPPFFQSRELTQSAQTVHQVLQLSIAIISAFFALLIILQPETSLQRIQSWAVFTVAAAILIEINRRGLPRPASWGLIITIGGILTIRTFTSGGIHAPSVPLYVALVLLAGFLLGEKAGIATGSIFIALLLIMALLEIVGAQPPSSLQFTPLTLWLFSAMPIALALVLQQLVSRTLSSALDNANRELRHRREAEQRLKLALDSGQIGVWNQESRRGELITDDYLFEVYQLPLSTNRTIPYALWLDRVHPEDRAKLSALLDGLWEKTGSDEIEFRILFENQSVRHMLLTGSSVTDESGAIKRVIGVNVDVTDRKQDEENLQRMNRELRARSEINAAIVRAQDEKQLLAEVCAILFKNVGFGMSWVGYAEHDEAKTVRPVAWFGESEEFIQFGTISWGDNERGQGPTGTAIRTGKTTCIPDTLSDPRLKPWIGHAIRYGFRSCLSLPLKEGSGRVFGAFTIYSKEVNAFSSSEITLLEELANELSFGIGALRLATSLRESERQFANAFEHAATGKAIVGLDGRWIRVNRALCLMLGYSEEELCSKTFLDVIHPEEIEDAQNLSARLIAGEIDSHHVEKRYVRKDGQIIWGFLSVSLLRNEQGNPIHFLSQIQNVTEHHNAQMERERLVEHLGERVKELKLLHQTARLLEKRHLTLQALFDEWVLLIPLAWRFSDICEARVCYGECEAKTSGWKDSPWKQASSFTAVGQTGRIEVVYTEEKPALDEGLFLSEEQALLDSLTEMLVGYLELREHREKLESLVESRTKDLTIAKEMAEKANQVKGMFLANISHEIRTPMNAILGYAQLMENDESIPETSRKNATVIRSSGDHLLQLINDILEMSRIEAGRVKLTEEPFDLHDALDEMKHMFLPLVARKRNQLTFQIDQDLPRNLFGDIGKIRQVIINLLSNDTKFTQNGSIHVRAALQSTSGASFTISITVTDSGRGIAPDDMQRIFVAFEQTESGMRAGGTGLGLTISRSFARMMGGDILVVSTLGTGSSFTFTFNATLATESPKPALKTPTGIRQLHPSHRGCRVLVVDDIETNREVLSDFLRRTGFAVNVAVNGEEAIRIHDEWHPKLILMDLRMPGIDGIETTRRLRANGSTAVIVALTASSIPNAQEEVRKAGGNAFFLKPYKEASLLQEIAKWTGVSFVTPDADELLTENSTDITQTVSLAELMNGVSTMLLDQLKDATLEADVSRVEKLAGQIQSDPARKRILSFTRNFQYDELLAEFSKVNSNGR
ncbi:MAG: PAS domain S-box protein [Verrucomicrobiota bacterium]|nr:PAS domain S-box protein [Verrucomicrobiota bacterium]